MPEWYKFKRWYNNLYRGERYLFNIFAFILLLAVLGWITHEPTKRKQNFPIKLGVQYDRRY